MFDKFTKKALLGHAESIFKQAFSPADVTAIKEGVPEIVPSVNVELDKLMAYTGDVLFTTSQIVGNSIRDIRFIRLFSRVVVNTFPYHELSEKAQLAIKEIKVFSDKFSVMKETDSLKLSDHAELIEHLKHLDNIGHLQKKDEFIDTCYVINCIAEEAAKIYIVR